SVFISSPVERVGASDELVTADSGVTGGATAIVSHEPTSKPVSNGHSSPSFVTIALKFKLQTLSGFASGRSRAHSTTPLSKAGTKLMEGADAGVSNSDSPVSGFCSLAPTLAPTLRRLRPRLSVVRVP